MYLIYDCYAAAPNRSDDPNNNIRASEVNNKTTTTMLAQKRENRCGNYWSDWHSRIEELFTWCILDHKSFDSRLNINCVANRRKCINLRDTLFNEKGVEES